MEDKPKESSFGKYFEAKDDINNFVFTDSDFLRLLINNSGKRQDDRISQKKTSFIKFLGDIIFLTI